MKRPKSPENYNGEALPRRKIIKNPKNRLAHHIRASEASSNVMGEAVLASLSTSPLPVITGITPKTPQIGGLARWDWSFGSQRGLECPLCRGFILLTIFGHFGL